MSLRNGLPAGDYYALIGGFDTKFEDNFDVTPGPVGGNYSLGFSVGEISPKSGSIAANEFAVISFTISDGDFDFDGELTFADIDLLIAQINSPESSSSFDLNADRTVDSMDIVEWTDLKNTWVGDANLDGEFNSGDFVSVFQAGKFENGVAASWSEGDWTGDGEFSTGDFVFAFQEGGYEQGLRGAVVAVPEPSSILLQFVLLGIVMIRHSTNSPKPRIAGVG